MKALSTGNKYERGVATLEILIAFAILILCISAVILLSFGNQSVAVDSETNNEALYKAQKALEDAHVVAEENYLSLISTSGTETSDGLLFTKTLDVTDITECKKGATSQVEWLIGTTRPQKIQLFTFFTDIAGALALGGDCDSDGPDDWDNPVTARSLSIGGQGATDIDVRNNFIYLTSDPSANPKEDFFIYEFDPIALSLTELSKIHVSPGLNAVDTIDGFAFTLNSVASTHLMVFDVFDPFNPTLIASISLPDMAVGIGRSIYYYDDFIYIGTQYLACPSCPPGQNNEFHIFEVSNPSIPIWRGSFKVNHNINDIVVRGNYAYLATSDDNGEVRVYDISNPANIIFQGLFDAPGNEDGEALYLLSNKLYLGRDSTPPARKDFYILDISTPSNPIELGSRNLALNPSALVIGIVVRGNLAFVGLDNPTSGLNILDVSDPSNITNRPICTSLNFSENSTAIDMEGNFVFSANRSNDEIRVIHDQTSTCP